MNDDDDAPCECCGGAGHIEVPVGRGPDTRLEPACCPACEGTGAQAYSHGNQTVPNDFRGDETRQP